LAAAHSQAKGALRESEMKFFKLAEMIAIGIFICHDTKFLYTNPAFQTTTGYTEAELLEMNFWDVTHPDHHELIKKQGVVYQGGEEVPSSYELGFVTKNGEVRWIDVNLDVIEFEGKVAILGSTFDLTERKRAEEILRQNEIRLSALLDAVPDMIFRMDAKGNIIDFKPASSEEFYVPPEQFLTRKVSEVLPPEVAELIEEHIDRAFATGVMQVFEYQLPGPTGFQDYEARLVTSVDNEVLAIVRNVTKRKRAEALILRSERLAALGQLAASLAHEVNNPLQAIQSHLDLVLDYPLEAGEREEYLNIIRQEVDRLKDVTRNTLDFASSKSTSRQPVSVTNVIQQILALINNKLRLSDIELTTDFYHVAPVLAEPAQLAEVFLNLLMNMIEAIESVATNGRLNIVVYPEDGEVAVSFTNSGPTIPQEELEHIFEPFFTTKPEGSGLGLWISYNLIQQHGGELTVENAGDTQGVIFTMKLPSAPDENSS
jgi:PAS domain S-box-containing protein